MTLPPNALRLAAEGSLAAFATLTHPSYRASWHHRLIADALGDVVEGRCKLLAISMPPRHGKSELASVRFAPWMLIKRPKASVISATYSGDFADDLGRKARGVLESPIVGQLWPHAQLAPDNRAVSRWQTKSGGSYYAVGVGGPLTGRGADILLIDDPHKNREEAESKVMRERVWDWFRSTAYTRLEKNGAVVVIMCMAGDTPVLRPDGSETPLRDIRPGDMVATYENGKLTTSRVMNWSNQGPDNLFRVKMKSGRVVRANARHPFLTINEHGEEEWVRTDQIQPGVSILTVTGASGAELHVGKMAATSRPVAKAYVGRTTTRPAGHQVIVRLRSTLRHVAGLASSIVTSSPTKRLTSSSNSRAESAPYVASRLRIATPEHTGTASCASITITPPGRCAGFSAMTATSQSGTENRQKPSAPLLTTWNVTPEEVVAVEPCGREDVFDVQIDRTENFIANGLVSHNTRWHEDDLVGRCIATGEPWRVLSLPAIAEQDEAHRAAGQALWPEKYDLPVLEQIRRTVGEREWAALYQQRPAPLEGGLFNPDRIEVIDAEPAGVTWVRAWDLGATANGGDPTAGAKLGQMPDGRYVIGHVVREQLSADGVVSTIKAIASQDGRDVEVNLPQDPGQAGKSQVQFLTRELAGYKVKSSPETGSKTLRAEPLAAQVNVGNVLMVRGPWNAALLDEMRVFPNGSHDDQVDALSRAFGRFCTPRNTAIIDFLAAKPRTPTNEDRRN